jgi:hypothetical protein
MNALTSISPRQMSNFFKDIISSDEIRSSLELNPSEVLSKYGIKISADKLPKTIKLPSKEVLQMKTRELLRSEQFSFPTRLNAQAGLPLAFVITVIFVFIPTKFVDIDTEN